MGSDYWISTKRTVPMGEVKTKLNEINDELFNGYFGVASGPEEGTLYVQLSSDNPADFADIVYPPYVFAIRPLSARRLGGRFVTWGWASFVQRRFMEALGRRLNGRMGVEGERTWAPDETRLETYKKYRFNLRPTSLWLTPLFRIIYEAEVHRLSVDLRRAIGA